jgi:hypothetical protein
MNPGVRSAARSPVCVSGTLLFDPGQTAENAAGHSCRDGTMRSALFASGAPSAMRLLHHRLPPGLLPGHDVRDRQPLVHAVDFPHHRPAGLLSALE